jgi:hypothetical protein
MSRKKKKPFFFLGGPGRRRRRIFNGPKQGARRPKFAL